MGRRRRSVRCDGNGDDPMRFKDPRLKVATMCANNAAPEGVPNITIDPAGLCPTFLSRATALIDRGFSTIPLLPKDKKPIPGIGANHRTRDLNVIGVWAQQYPDANAAVCADGQTTILESDNADLLKAKLAAMGVTLPETLTGGARANRPHYFFKRTPECGETCLQVPALFEFRNAGQYVVGPGSIHPGGHGYRFWNDAPMVEMPADVLYALHELAEGYSGEARTEHIQPGPYAALRNAYLRGLDPTDMLQLDGLAIGEGERHYTLVSLAGLLHDGERTAEDIAEILRQVQDAYFIGAKSDQEIQSIAEYAVRKEPCEFEPYDLPSFSFGTIVFSSAEAQEEWLKDHVDAFSDAWEYMAVEELPEQRELAHLNNVPLLREETINEVFAYRGLGKSMFVGSLIKILTTGGEFLGIRSSGGNRVLLVDGELPKRLLQSRLRSLVGKQTGGLFRVRSLAKVKNGYMPALADRGVQEQFVAALKGWRPNVIIFDTRTAIFQHDTNDAEQLMLVNQFLIRLRAEGYTVILTHHAGKNGSQRGRTDNDDPLDLIIQLNKRDGWTPGAGLEFSLAFEKVRYGDRLEGFDARYTTESGWERLEPSENRIVQALLEGTSINRVAKDLRVGVRRVMDAKALAEKNGTQFPELTPGRKAKRQQNDYAGSGT
jgi:hypothetical protein